MKNDLWGRIPHQEPGLRKACACHPSFLNIDCFCVSTGQELTVKYSLKTMFSPVIVMHLRLIHIWRTMKSSRMASLPVSSEDAEPRELNIY